MTISLISPYAAKAHTYRGQLHCHSNVLEGALSPYDLVNAYKLLGYDFVCISDHDYNSDPPTPDPGVLGVLYIPGMEESVTDPTGHMNQVGALHDAPDHEAQYVINMAHTDGAYIQFNHPGLSALTAVLMGCCYNYHGIEAYNYISNAEIGHNDEGIWDDLLTLGIMRWGTATDDCHGDPALLGVNASVYVYADAITQTEILTNLKNGNFYASLGSATLTISVTGLIVTVNSPDAAVISFIGKNGTVYKTESSVTSSAYTIIGNEGYIRAKVFVSATKYALTNPIKVIDSTGGPIMAALKGQNIPAIQIVRPIGSLNANWIVTSSNSAAYSFVIPRNPFDGALTLSQVRVFNGATTDSPKVTAYIYNDNSGLPGTMITNGASVETVVPYGSWLNIEWSGTLPVLTPGVQYWVVFKCTTGTNFSLAYVFGAGTFLGSPGQVGGNLAGSGKAWKSCSAFGVDGVWGSTPRDSVQGVRIKITDGVSVGYYGDPIIAYSTTDSVAYRCDGTLQPGLRILTPANVKLRVAGLALSVNKTGTPGNLSMNVYKNTDVTPIATSNVIPSTNLPTYGANGGVYMFDFATVVVLDPATEYRFVLSAASGSNAANYYFFFIGVGDKDADSLSMYPLNSGVCVFNGSSWNADKLDYQPAFVLTLDNELPFASVGGLMINPGLSGGLR